MLFQMENLESRALFLKNIDYLAQGSIKVH